MDQYYEANAILSVFSRHYMELKKGLPVRPSEMGVLNILAKTPGPHTPVRLAEMLCVSKAMVTAHLTSLTDKGYILRKPSTEDKRACHILLTDKGQALVESAQMDMQRQLENLRDGMGQAQFDMLIALVQQANQVFAEKCDADRTE